MFDIGFLELLLLGVVGLLVLGPERLPKAARTVGLWIGKIKRTVSGMQRDISAQLEAEELRQKLDEQQKKLDASLHQVKQDVERYAEPDSPDTQRPRGPQGDDRARLDGALAQRRDATSTTSETSSETDKDDTQR